MCPLSLSRFVNCNLNTNQPKTSYISLLHWTVCSRQCALYSVRCTFYLRVGVHYNRITVDKQTKNTHKLPPSPRISKQRRIKWTTTISLIHSVVCHEHLYRLSSTNQLCYILLILRTQLFVLNIMSNTDYQPSQYRHKTLPLNGNASSLKCWSWLTIPALVWSSRILTKMPIMANNHLAPALVGSEQKLD